MKESMWGYLIVILGVVILAILILVQRLTTTNEEDYYLSREVLKAAMLDAVDYGTYMKEPHKLVMSREKFVAVFTRRFADSVTADKDYRIDFYDIYEYPPKATIRISTNTGEVVVNEEGVNIEVNTFITGILETTDEDGLFTALFSVDGNVDGEDGTNIVDGRKVLSWVGEPVANHQKADVNNDGKIDYLDASMIESAVLGKYKQGDVNMDGEINEDDRKLIKVKNLSTKESRILADLDGSGKINDNDLKLFDKIVSGGSVSKNIRGDVNGDGRVTSTDVLWLSQYLNNKRTLSETQLANANFNKNGNSEKKVDNTDLSSLIESLLTGDHSYKNI